MSVTYPNIDGPTDLPDLRTWLLKRWQPRGVIDGFPYFAEHSPWVRQTLQSAQLWWVEEEACDLLAACAPTLPDDHRLSITDLPTPAGFAMFAHDLIGTDASPETSGTETCRVSGISWAPINIVPKPGGQVKRPLSGIGIGLWSRFKVGEGLETNDGVSAELALEVEFLNVALAGRPGWCCSFIGRTDWIDGWMVTDPMVDNPHGDDPTVMTSMLEDRKLLASLWAIVKTPMVSAVRTQPPRPVRRRAEREGTDASVRVLRLGGEHRENVPGATGALSPREWHHSWVVRPHWRWQAHGPGRSLRKLILVPAHRKGPADKPLLGGDRVWRVMPPSAA